jgi:hypothetical protein
MLNFSLAIDFSSQINGSLHLRDNNFQLTYCFNRFRLEESLDSMIIPDSVSLKTGLVLQKKAF